MPSSYDVTAIRFGESTTTRAKTFYRYQSYGEPDAEIQLHYFFWLARSNSEIVLIDTGYHFRSSESRNRPFLVEPMEALEALGVPAESVGTILISHFHYDHIGNASRFPNARIIVQQKELDFWMGVYGKQTAVASSTDAEAIEYLKSARSTGRLECIDGNSEVLPGIHAQLVGGHSPGQQIVVVEAAGALVVIASDALHFYEELDKNMPFITFSDLRAVYDAFGVLRDYQTRERAIIVAGHDPWVTANFPPVPGPASSFAVRLG